MAGGGLGVVQRVGGAAVTPAVVTVIVTRLAAFHVGLGVFSKVVRPHEPLVTSGTGEPLLPCVRPEVPLQLV